jgi:hypothetical protein
VRGFAIPVLVLAGCLGEGSVDLHLRLPADQALRPTEMSTITVVARRQGEDSITTTSPIRMSGGRATFDSGDLPVDDVIELSVELRSTSGRLVGYGVAPTPFTPRAGESVDVDVPVRKPFIYVASGVAVRTIDPSLDDLAPAFQGQLSNIATASLTVPISSADLAVVSGGQLVRVATTDHQPSGANVPLPPNARDIASVPTQDRVVIGHDGGIAIVDVATGTRTDIAGVTGSVRKVTVGRTGTTWYAYGLVNQVLPPMIGACTGVSTIARVDLDAMTAETLAPGKGIADITATGDGRLYAAASCDGAIHQIDITGVATAVADIDRPTTIATWGDRVWAAGNLPRMDINTDGDPEPEQIIAARPLLVSIDLAGSNMQRIELEPRRETMITASDPVLELAQVMNARTLTPLDLAIVPGGQYIVLGFEATYDTVARVDIDGNIIIPEMQATSDDVAVIDTATGGVAQRIRSRCNLDFVGPSHPLYGFADWTCDIPPAGQVVTGADYQPGSLSVLFGAR